jgi:hypothetical protein
MPPQRKGFAAGALVSIAVILVPPSPRRSLLAVRCPVITSLPGRIWLWPRRPDATSAPATGAAGSIKVAARPVMSRAVSASLFGALPLVSVTTR